jgi:hypothetical protein
MPALRDILDRFRPAPGPGRAGPVGVPTAAIFTGADELEPVFAALDDVLARCETIREDARRQVAEIQETADLRLASLRAEAATTADQARAASDASVKAVGQARQAAELVAAEDEAARIRADGIERMTPYVAAAVSRVRNLPGSHTLTARPGDGS